MTPIEKKAIDLANEAIQSGEINLAIAIFSMLGANAGGKGSDLAIHIKSFVKGIALPHVKQMREDEQAKKN